jgi:hypothetical protein
MKVENIKMKASVFLVAILTCGLLGVYLYNNAGGGGNNIVNEAGQTFLLVNPVFAQSASSEATFLDEEAGMSIYVKIGRSIDLAVAKTVYRTIEKETSNYTVGSIALPGLSENEDVHCFVHKDGWIVTYYLKGEPISKIVDWNLWSEGKLTENKLQVGLEQMTNALGVVVTSVKYYHFQYPNANKCMLIIETLVTVGEDSFNITIPSELAVYERSWSHYAGDTTTAWGGTKNSYFKIDGSIINSISGESNPVTKYGMLTVTQLLPDMVHIVSVYNDNTESSKPLYGVCIGLAYQEP